MNELRTHILKFVTMLVILLYLSWDVDWGLFLRHKRSWQQLLGIVPTEPQTLETSIYKQFKLSITINCFEMPIFKWRMCMVKVKLFATSCSLKIYLINDSRPSLTDSETDSKRKCKLKINPGEHFTTRR